MFLSPAEFIEMDLILIGYFLLQCLNVAACFRARDEWYNCMNEATKERLYHYDH